MQILIYVFDLRRVKLFVIRWYLFIACLLNADDELVAVQEV